MTTSRSADLISIQSSAADEDCCWGKMRTKLLAPRPELKVPVAMDSLAAKVPHSPSGSSCASLLRWRYSQCKDCLPKPWSDRLRLICGYKIISIKVSCVMVCPKLEYIYTFFFSLFSPLFGQEVSCTGDGTSYPSYEPAVTLLRLNLVSIHVSVHHWSCFRNQDWK